MKHKGGGLKAQSGQSVVEALVLFLVLLVMFMAIPWLGRLSDIGLQQANASRYAAFQLTRHHEGIDENDLKHRYFLDEDHQWKDRANNDLITSDSIYLSLNREQKLGSHMQAGGEGSHQQTLRREWEIEDKGIATIAVHTRPQYTQVDDKTDSAMSVGLSYLEQQVLNIHRHTSILTDAAHSASDLSAHQRSGSSDLAWREATEGSYESGKKVAEIAVSVDAAWERPNPVFDWLSPWEGQLPGHHLEVKKGDSQ